MTAAYSCELQPLLCCHIPAMRQNTTPSVFMVSTCKSLWQGVSRVSCSMLLDVALLLKIVMCQHNYVLGQPRT